MEYLEYFHSFCLLSEITPKPKDSFDKNSNFTLQKMELLGTVSLFG